MKPRLMPASISDSSRFPFPWLRAGVALLVGCATANAQWVATPLSSGDPFTHSVAAATNGSLHAGTVGNGSPYASLISSADPARAVLWAAGGTATLLQPGIPSQVSAIYGASQGGSVLIDGSSNAALWSGVAGVFANLHPAGYTSSRIVAMSATHQGGSAFLDGVPHGGLWSGTAGSFVDLHPVGATRSAVGALSGNRQGGAVSFTPDAGATFGAALWAGTAESFISLNPPGATLSSIDALTDSYEAGYAYFAGVCHAGLWFGSAESFVSLQPANATSSRVAAVAGDFQGGSAAGDELHAALWQGSAASYLDLHGSVVAALGGGFTRSEILGGSLDEFGSPVFVGYAYNPETFLYQAVVWTMASIPEPSAYAALSATLMLALCLVHRARAKSRV